MHTVDDIEQCLPNPTVPPTHIGYTSGNQCIQWMTIDERPPNLTVPPIHIQYAVRLPNAYVNEYLISVRPN